MSPSIGRFLSLKESSRKSNRKEEHKRGTNCGAILLVTFLASSRSTDESRRNNGLVCWFAPRACSTETLQPAYLFSSLLSLHEIIIKIKATTNVEQTKGRPIVSGRAIRNVPFAYRVFEKKENHLETRWKSKWVSANPSVKSPPSKRADQY